MQKPIQRLFILSFGVTVFLSAANHSLLGTAPEKDRVTLCHTLANPDVTMEVPPAAADAHLGHGDYLGACTSSESSSSSISSDSSSSSSMSSDSSSSSSMSSDSSSSSSESPPPPSSSSSSSEASNPANNDNAQSQEHRAAPSGRSGGSDNGSQFAVFRGSGIAELAAVTHSTLVQYGLHEESPYKYTFHHDNVRPDEFASHEAATDWTLREHAACCSIYRYLTRVRENRPYIKPGYIDWLTDQLAQTLNEDPDAIRAALLGHPHIHPHASELVRSITAEGCAENAYVYGGESSAESAEDHQPSAHMEHMIDASSAAESLTATQKDIPGEIAFAIMDGENVFTDYGVSHTKEMHLLVIRNDLRHFHHVHPERDADGVWHVPFVPPAGGTYWIYADFIGKDDTAHTVRFERTYDADPGEHGLEKNTSMVKYVGKYVVTLTPTVYDQGILFTVNIRDERYKDAPLLEPYLGAMGHGILISPDGKFIHTHPSPAGDLLVFHTPQIRDGFYRIFTQFQIQEEIFTVEFDWEAKPEQRQR